MTPEQRMQVWAWAKSLDNRRGESPAAFAEALLEFIEEGPELLSGVKLHFLALEWALKNNARPRLDKTLASAAEFARYAVLPRVVSKPHKAAKKTGGKKAAARKGT